MAEQQQQDELARGLSAMADTQAIHTEMLRRLLELASQEPPASTVPEQLAAILEAVRANTAAVTAVIEKLDALPEAIAEAVGQEMP